MIVFKNYADIIKKQFPTVLVYGAILILLVYILSNTTQEKTFIGYEQTQVRIAVFNYDEDSVLVTELLDYLEKYCEIVTISEKWQSKLDALLYRNVYYILTIPSGFSEQFLTEDALQLEINSVEVTQEANYVNQAVNAYLDYVKLYHYLYPDMDLQQITDRVNIAISASVEVIEAGDDTLKEENANTNYYFNLLGFILLACVLMVVCSAMAAYRKDNIYRRHIISPLSPMSLSLQLLLGNIAYVYLYTILFLGLGVAIGNEKSLSIRTVLYWVNTFAYVTSILFFAFFLAYRLKKRMMITLIPNTVGFVLALISGIFIRQEYLPDELVKVSSITPVYWYVRGNDTIMTLSGYRLDNILPLVKIIGIQLLFAAAFLSLVLVGAKLDETRK